MKLGCKRLGDAAERMVEFEADQARPERADDRGEALLDRLELLLT